MTDLESTSNVSNRHRIDSRLDLESVSKRSRSGSVEVGVVEVEEVEDVEEVKEGEEVEEEEEEAVE